MCNCQKKPNINIVLTICSSCYYYEQVKTVINETETTFDMCTQQGKQMIARFTECPLSKWK